MAKIINKLFVLGTDDSTQQPYSDIKAGLEVDIAGEQAGNLITASDINTFIRSTSLVTCSFIDIIKESEKSASGVSTDLDYSTAKSEARALIKDCLEGYIFNSEIYASNNLKGTNPAVGDMYYISSIDSGKVKTDNVHASVVSSQKKSANVLTQSNDANHRPEWKDSLSLDVLSAKRVIGNDGKRYRLNFALNNKTLTIQWIQED